ncbi:MAG: DNA internalization-related competence protein ComEC/Rec2 [Hydrogenophaga sp.]|nr:DNA internalization-related competence protein ComEC/Rec2 [Hydrogenophaga sp.]
MAGGVVGTAVQLLQAHLWPVAVYQVLALGGLLAMRWRLRAAWLLAGAALAFGCTGWRAGAYLGQGLSPALEGRDIAVVGRVASLPQTGPGGERFEFVVEQATLDGEAVSIPARLLLGWYVSASEEGASARLPGLWAGERWAFGVRLKRPHGSRNPHGFDRERWLWEQGIGATGHVRLGARDAAPRRLGQTPWHPVDRVRQAISRAIAERVDDPRAAGVLAALVVGEQSAIERADWALFRDTGVAHLMAISGLHITLFAWLATALMGALWRVLGRHWPALPMHCPAGLAAGWGGLACAAAYALLAGWGVPAQRTVLMLAVVVGLRASVRRWPWPAVWLLAMAAVLALDPLALLAPGFWLSFLAVAVLFTADPARGGTGSDAPGGWQRGLRAAGALWREQWLMTLALAPLGLVLFGQVSLVGLLANLVAIPWVTLVVTPLALLGALVAPLWGLAAAAVDALVALLQVLAAWPWAVLHRPAVPAPLALAAVLGGVLLAVRLPPVLRFAGLLLVAPALLYVPPRPAPGAFDVTAIDVGQGSAVLVRTAKHALVYDAGPRWNPEADAGERIVLPLLRALGVQPDRVLISHRDSDHAGGADALRAAFPGAVWQSSFDADPARRCLAGERWQWDGVDFELLHPGAAAYAAPGLSSNAMSCVLRIAAGGQVAWLAGDIPAAQEVRLALARPQERATLLLAPHHGSATSSSPVLLNTLQPRWVIVQSGYRNRFGHPAAGVVARYDARGIAWVDSPRCGAATWRSDAPEAMRCEREVSRRYWHHPDRPMTSSAGPELAILPPGEKDP